MPSDLVNVADELEKRVYDPFHKPIPHELAQKWKGKMKTSIRYADVRRDID